MAKKQPSTEKKSKPAAKPSSGSKSAKGVKAAQSVEAAPASAAEAKSPAPKKKTSAAAKAPTSTRAITLEEIGVAAGDVWGALSNGNGEQTLATIKKTVDAPADLVVLALGWLAREDKLSITATGRDVTIGLK